jgi:phospholipase/lecithinase/hemolysin
MLECRLARETRMLTRVTVVAVAVAVASYGAGEVAQACPPPVRSDVNYAQGGATSGTGSFVDLYQPALAQAIRAFGLDLGGLDRQVTLAEKTLFDVDPRSDVFWVWAGANDYIVGERDPTLPPARIGAALERLYTGVGARVFVVPNLPALGFFPAIAASSPTASAGMNQLAGGHNQVLAGVLAQFAAAHPDATVIPVDAWNAFLPLLGDPRFENVTQSCVDVAVPAGLGCDAWLFVDGLHVSTLAQAAFAQAAAGAVRAALGAAPVRRIIGFGDSFSDTGELFDTELRATGVGSPPAPLYYQGRFSNGPVAFDYLQDLLAVEVPTRFFAQPLAASVTAAPPSHGHGQGAIFGRLDLVGSVLVPGRILTPGPASGQVTLDFGGGASCRYRPAPAGASAYLLDRCSDGSSASARVDVRHRVTVVAEGCGLTSLRVELLYY